MDVQLDLSMRTAGILEGWSLTDYQLVYKEIPQTLSTDLEPRVIDGHVIQPNLVLAEVSSLTLVPMDTEAQALIQILQSILDH